MKHIFSSKWFGYPFILFLLLGDYSNQSFLTVIILILKGFSIGLIISFTVFYVEKKLMSKKENRNSNS